MLNQITKDKLKALGIDADKLIEAAKAETETDFAIPEGVLMTETQLIERDGIKMKEGKKEGEKSAFEIAKKEFGKNGIEIKSERWGDAATEIKSAINSSSDSKISSLQEQNTALLADNEKYKGEAVQAKSALEAGLFEVGILTQLPAHAAGLTAKESLELAKMRGYTPEKTDAGVIWKKNGEVLKDATTHAPLPSDKAISHIWEAEKWGAAAAAAQGGRGAGDGNPSSGTGLSTASSAMAQWQKDNPNKNIVSPEATAYLAGIAKDNPNFNWNA